MAVKYLLVDFSENASVKSLGARWDARERKWFVPEGHDLAPFEAWLPAGSRFTELALGESASGVVEVQRPGKTLSELLTGVANAVSQAYREGIWTIVDVVQATVKNHVYLELAERNSNGVVLAKARGMIWARVANEILPPFEAATGMSIGPGIKLLVRARPVFSPQHGLTLTVDAIDPDYTLGDLEARKREIRARLRQEGLWGMNKALEFPWDFTGILVVAPRDAAGLGDFRVEASRLARARVCKFIYAFSRFQGEGAATEILNQTRGSLLDWERQQGGVPDAVVFIRGGGPVNDLSWLNNYDLARFVCGLDIPVLTGIGHERDSTVLDEVANTSFDTPSKVIAGIEMAIIKRTREAQAAFDGISDLTRSRVTQVRRSIEESIRVVEMGASRQLHHARGAAAEAITTVRLGATRSVGEAAEFARDVVRSVHAHVMTHIALARQEAPLLLAQVRDRAQSRLQSATSLSGQALVTILDRAHVDARSARTATSDTIRRLEHDARQGISRTSSTAEALIREISGQGPQKTLARGFAHVRDESGKTVMSAAHLADGTAIIVAFHDGAVPATVGSKGKKT